MNNYRIIDRCKRLIKDAIPFEVRHRMQLYLSTHPESGVRDFFRQDTITSDHHERFFHILDEIGEFDFSNKCVCELGPGGCLSNAFFIYQMGGQSSFLIDVYDFVNIEKMISQKEYDDLSLPESYIKKTELPAYRSNKHLFEYLKEINSIYYYDGLQGYKKVPDNSVDFLFSCTVLQHIRRNIFVDSINEMYRMMKPGGIAFHTVDLKDMLGGKKNHLRYCDEYWNDDVHKNMRCYTNRIQCSEMCKLFTDTGFKIIKLNRAYFEEIPINNKLLSKEFKTLSKKDLFTETFSVMMKKC